MRTRLAVLVPIAAALAAVVLVAVPALRTPPAPYVVTAIDYHFHDAHPSLPIVSGQDLVIKNEGRNIHNVTFEAQGYSRDIEPGQQLVIPDVAEFLGGTGRYPFYCAYHRNLGMKGVIVIAP